MSVLPPSKLPCDSCDAWNALVPALCEHCKSLNECRDDCLCTIARLELEKSGTAPTAAPREPHPVQGGVSQPEASSPEALGDETTGAARAFSETRMPRPNDPDKNRGLYRKFIVERVDPESQARHSDCYYFVLDKDHDAFAAPAMLAYAVACEAEYPQLAQGIRKLVFGDVVAAPAETDEQGHHIVGDNTGLRCLKCHKYSGVSINGALICGYDLAYRLAEAANEINCAGPVAHRIRQLKKYYDEMLSEAYQSSSEANDRLTEVAEKYRELAQRNAELEAENASLRERLQAAERTHQADRITHEELSRRVAVRDEALARCAVHIDESPTDRVLGIIDVCGNSIDRDGAKKIVYAVLQKLLSENYGSVQPGAHLIPQLIQYNAELASLVAELQSKSLRPRYPGRKLVVHELDNDGRFDLMAGTYARINRMNSGDSGVDQRNVAQRVAALDAVADSLRWSEVTRVIVEMPYE